MMVSDFTLFSTTPQTYYEVFGVVETSVILFGHEMLMGHLFEHMTKHLRAVIAQSV
jgi:hypothetical protein